MGKLVVKREKRFVGGMNTVYVYLDNKVIGTLKNGEEKEFDVKDTIYTIKAGTGMFSGMSNSEDIAIRDNHYVLVNVNLLSSKVYLLVCAVFLISIISIGMLFLSRGINFIHLILTLIIFILFIILNRNLFYITSKIIKDGKENQG